MLDSEPMNHPLGQRFEWDDILMIEETALDAKRREG